LTFITEYHNSATAYTSFKQERTIIAAQTHVLLCVPELGKRPTVNSQNQVPKCSTECSNRSGDKILGRQQVLIKQVLINDFT
jgi:hypothetical protein